LYIFWRCNVAVRDICTWEGGGTSAVVICGGKYEKGEEIKQKSRKKKDEEIYRGIGPLIG
jgi:hypothetical protein